MNFDLSFNALIDHERGFQNNPKDRGNWTSGQIGVGVLKGTKYGISAMVYPGEDIENLTLDRAKELYRRDYWGPAGCDAVPDAIKFDLFDMAVNSGVKNAVKTLQTATEQVADGDFGPKSLMAVQSMAPTRLAARFNGARLMFLTNMKEQIWDEFGKGLVRRVAKNLLAI